ncbi:MAG: UDP-N-acetylglucosamine 1-carboxyvinyltransferase [Acidobacteria bacterium]|nr:UDP-N-acetylglucosamine 1-carboxyvinyltransferase [Acidobacteriota bacterium]
MSTLLVEGGHRLEGRVTVEGNKNAALPLLAACLLTEQECLLTNMPRIRDVEVMAALLVDLGAEVNGIGTSTLRVRCRNVSKDAPGADLVGRLRGSVLLLGPLLARRGSARLADPGGDFPSRRTLSTHLQALTAMGAHVVDVPGNALEAPNGLKPASLYLEEASVTGTETALLAAAAAPGRTQLRHAACEPHVVELCRFLQKLGAGIDGAGTSTISVEGGMRLGGAAHQLSGDYLEAGSWAVVTAVTGGAAEITGATPDDLEPVTSVLERMQVQCRLDSDVLHILPSTPVGLGRLTTGLWPGFPSDFVSLLAVLATQAKGRTLIHDWMYELRLFALEQLSGMGADFFLCDPHRIIVTGPTRLRGRQLDGRDLRSGMALIAAALAADGESRVRPLETVERGYSSVVEHLKALGAKVERLAE